MRSIIAGSLVTTVLLIAGCDMPWMRHDDKTVVRPPPAFGKTPDVTQLVNYLNENADRLPGVQAEVAMDCRQNKTSVGIDGNLACSRPRNFRLKGFAVGQPVVDIGSNESEFWYWISKADPPYVFHCSYADLSRGNVHMPFPFQPDMVGTALGLAKYDPTRNYRIKESAKYLELIEDAVTPDGQSIDKVTVFNRMEARRGEPQVMGHVLRTKQGHTLCYATIQRVTVDAPTGAVIPQQLVLVWPDQKLEMDMRLQRIRIAGFDARQAEDRFSRRHLTGLKSYDLARQALDGGVQPAGLR